MDPVAARRHSLVYGRSAAIELLPRVVGMLGVLLCGVGVVFCASASSCGVHGDS